MSETHTPEIRPATDEEIAAMQHDCGTRSACDHGQFGPCREQNLFARIESDRATIAELLAALERFADRRCRFDMPGLCAKVTNIEKCDRCHARAVIQKAKESR